MDNNNNLVDKLNEEVGNSTTIKSVYLNNDFEVYFEYSKVLCCVQGKTLVHIKDEIIRTRKFIDRQ